MEKARLPKAAVTLVVRIEALKGQEAALERELRALVEPTRAERGCLKYELHRSADGPRLFLLYEVWASREDHTRHTQTPHFQHWEARKNAVLSSRNASFWTQVR